MQYKSLLRKVNRFLLLLMATVFISYKSQAQCVVVNNAPDPSFNGTYTPTGSLNFWNTETYTNGTTFLHLDGGCWYLSYEFFNIYNGQGFYFDNCSGNSQFPGTSGWIAYDSNWNMTNLNLTTAPCPDVPILSSSSNLSCPGATITLTATGNLIQGENWYWYEGNCAGNSIGSGTSITVNPTSNTVYSCRAENTANSFIGSCATINTNVSTSAPSIYLGAVPVVCSTPRTITNATLHLLAFDDYGNSCNLPNNTNGFVSLKINGTSVFSTNLNSMTDPCGESFNFPITNLNEFVEGVNVIQLVTSDGTNFLSKLGWAYLTVQYSDGSSLPIDITWGASSDAQWANLCNVSWYNYDACWSLGSPNEINTSFFNSTVQLGTVSASVSGGVQPYDYTWTATNGGNVGGQVNATYLENVPVGTYTLTVLDQCNQSANNTVEMTQIEGATITSSLTLQPSCGLNNGKIEIQLADVCGAPTIVWTSVPAGLVPAGQENGLVLNNLGLGQYIVSVTDNNGTSQRTFNLQGNTLTINPPTIQQPSCPSTGNEGAIFLNMWGGNQPLSYSWTTTNGNIPAGLETEFSLYYGLTAGTYNVVVTDACNQQVYSQSFMLTTPNGPSIASLFNQSPTCVGGTNGAISVDVQNSCGPLNIIGWTSTTNPSVNGITDTYIENLPAGTYTFSAEDNNGISTQTIVLNPPTSPEALTLTAEVFPVVCNTPLTVTNVRMIYHYRNGIGGDSWCGETGVNGNWDLSVNGNLAYSGQVSPTDVCGSIDTLDLTTQLASLILNGQNTFDINVINPTNGGGVADWGWSVLQITTNNNETTNILLSGNYSFLDNCSNPFQSYFGVCGNNGNPNTNPWQTSGNVALFLGGLVLTDVDGGTWPFDYEWTGPNGFTSTDSDLEFVPEGQYTLVIEDACGQTTTQNFTIGAPNGPLVAFPEFLIPSCPTSNDGALAVFVLDAGPCGPNVLSWTASNGGVIPAGQEDSEELIGIPAGTYTLTATNSNGTITQTYTLQAPAPAPLSVSLVADQIACQGVTSKQVSEIKLEWYAGNNDESGFVFKINGDTIVEMDADPTDNFNCNGYMGTYTTSNPSDLATIQSGVNHFEFNLSYSNMLAYARAIIKFSDNSQQFVTLVQPENGTIGQQGFNLCDYGVLYGQDWDTTASIQLGTGAALVLANVTGGTPNYTYSWNNNSTLAGVFVSNVGSYNVTVTDACGVTATAQTAVSIDYSPAPAIPTVVSTAANCTTAGSSQISDYDVNFIYTFTPNGPTVDNNGNISGMTFETFYTLTAANQICTSEETLAFSNSDVISTPENPTISSTVATCESAGVNSISNFSTNLTYIFSPVGPTVNANGEIENLTEGENYNVIASNNGCESQASTSFTMIPQLASPAQPTILEVAATCTAAGSASINNYDSDLTYTFSPAGPSVNAEGQVTNVTFGTSYTVTAANTNCPSIQSEGFIINNFTTINVAVTNNNNTLSATQTGATYQWINCANNQTISGATNASFTPTVNGSYKVRITLNGCVEESECVTVNTVGMENISNENIVAYPNPTSTLVHVKGLGSHVNHTLTVIDQMGRTIQTSIINNEIMSVDLTHLPNGVYLVKIENVGTPIRVVKQ